MCTPFAHALAGYTFIALAEPQMASDIRGNLKTFGAGFIFGTLADADFLVAYHTHNPVLQHHYFTHSVPFVIALGAFLYLVLKLFMKTGVLRMALALTGAYGTHLMLDYFTHDGSAPIGIPLAWPFSHKHFVAPVEFFLSIHRGSMQALFGLHNFVALFREALILTPIAYFAYRKSRETLNAETQRRRE